MLATTRAGRHLQCQGWRTRDAEGSQLTVDREDTALAILFSHSITYRIALGPGRATGLDAAEPAGHAAAATE